MKQRTLLQNFEWYLPKDGSFWRQTEARAAQLAREGFTHVWLPPAYKGASGMSDTGYGVYDLYDLGEFDQKGTVPTKYGTKEEYLRAVEALRKEGLAVMPDIVLNHKMGADACETVRAQGCTRENREQSVGPEEEISAWTSFTFPGRGNRYSSFHWNHTHFDGVDWDDRRKRSQIYELDGKNWDEKVDREHGNYDYLMGADLDMDNREVLEELDRFGKWYLDLTGADGFRLDAVKHINSGFFTNWLGKLREESGRELWSVGEYWSPYLSALTNYLGESRGAISLFDVPLHFNLMQASAGNGAFDMRKIFENSLVSVRPDKAVTFVDNHDTQPGQALQSWVQGWFKPLAYALILLREGGVPCVFYGDYYGIPHDNIGPVGTQLAVLLSLRQSHAFGTQTDYLDHPDVIGWTRQGDGEHPGCAVLLTNGPGGEKRMCMGSACAGAVFTDALKNRGETVVIDREGWGTFTVNGGSVSVWIPEKT